MEICSIQRCINNNRGVNSDHIEARFELPIDANQREQWITAIDGAGLPTGNISFVCRRHFIPSDFATDVPLSLKESAVPSNFPFASVVRIQPTHAPRKMLLKPYLPTKKADVTKPKRPLATTKICSIKRCINNTRDFNSIGAEPRFELPINPEKQARWITAIAAAGLPTNNISYICKRHFRPTDFTRATLFTLKETAVPSNFPFPLQNRRIAAPTKIALKTYSPAKPNVAINSALPVVPEEIVPSSCTKCNQPNILDLKQKIQQVEEKCKQKEFEENEINLEMELLNECLRVRNKSKFCNICRKQILGYDYHRHICRRNMPIVRCEYCPWAFVSVSSLQRHVHAFHATENVIVGCEFCLEEFETPLLLEIHNEMCHVKRESQPIIDEKPSFVIESVEEMVDWQEQGDCT